MNSCSAWTEQKFITGHSRENSAMFPLDFQNGLPSSEGRFQLMEALLEHIQSELQEQIGLCTSVAGGDINQAFRLETEKTAYFLKVNDAQTHPSMLKKEAEGLEELDKASDFDIPQVLKHGEWGGLQFLILDFIERGSASAGHWEQFGHRLAHMHRQGGKESKFGWKSDNYIGSLHQKNEWSKDWPEFFANNRVLPLVRSAMDSGRLSAQDALDAERLLSRIKERISKEPSSLLHGDLWSGNFMFTTNGTATIFDPSVYYGHREMDIAMSRLFGGFDLLFYEAYNESWPMSPGWEERLEIWNLYPILVHVNLFGGGYSTQFRETLRTIL